MADPPPYSTPRWVKIFILIAIVSVLLVAVTMLIIGGDHGPGRHMPSSGAGDTPAAMMATYYLKNVQQVTLY